MGGNFFGNPARLTPAQAELTRLDGGAFVLRSPEPLQPFARCIGEWLEHWAVQTPGSLALAERETTGGWRRLTYAELRASVGAIAHGLLDLRLRVGGPVVVLSDNSIDHALLMLAAMHIGRPVCTVSSAYSRMTRDHRKIHGILQTLAPARVYASDAAVFGPALADAGLDAVLVFSQGAADHHGAVAFDSLTARREGGAVMQSFNAIQPGDHAKYLLTSGSTGHQRCGRDT